MFRGLMGKQRVLQSVCFVLLTLNIKMILINCRRFSGAVKLHPYIHTYSSNVERNYHVVFNKTQG